MLSHCLWYGGGWSPWFMLFPLGMFALFILAMLIFWRRGGMCGGMMMHRHNSAMDILKERYAKGEIGKDEFERMKKDIQD